jgi:hypothetical protein
MDKGENTIAETEGRITMTDLCIRCGSPDTSHWRVDDYGFVKFYCDNCWQQYLLDRKKLEDLRIPKWLPACLAERLLFFRSHRTNVSKQT